MEKDGVVLLNNSILCNNYRWLFIVTNRLKKMNLYEKYVYYQKHYLINLINKKHLIIMQIKLDLLELKSMDKDIYYEIVINGKNVDDTIKNISQLYNCSKLNVWKTYFSKIHVKIKKILNIIFCD